MGFFIQKAEMELFSFPERRTKQDYLRIDRSQGGLSRYRRNVRLYAQTAKRSETGVVRNEPL